MNSASWVLYDGDCGLCARSVRFIRRHAAPGHFQFAPILSPEGRALARSHPDASLPSGASPGSVLWVDSGGRVFDRSAAAVRIAWRLRFPWCLLAAFWLVPWPLRDLGYRFVARHRFRWFGRTSACDLPDPPPSA